MQKLLTTDEAAEILGLAPATLVAWRATGRTHLPFVRIGRLTRYRPEDVKSFVDMRLRA